MPAVLIDTEEPSAVHSPQSVTEKLDDSRAPPSNFAEESRTNGNGNARQETEKDESEGDASTEEEELEGGEGDAKEESLDVRVGQYYDDDGGEDEDEDEDEEEEEEGDDYDDDDEEEEEPSLKYERMGGPVNDLLKKDSASALAVSNKCLVRPLSRFISRNSLLSYGSRL